MIKYIYIILGSLFIALGVVGIVVPGLPTTPFLLLAAWFFMRSSKRLYFKLTRSKFLGKYIRRYERNRGLRYQTKIYSISLMWVMIILSCVFMINHIAICILVVVVGIIGTYVMGFYIKTINPPKKSVKNC